jgi:two-component sensor histidine kinase
MRSGPATAARCAGAEQAPRRASAERLRLARELHDAVGHHLSLINLHAGVALHLNQELPAQARSSLAAIKQASNQALGELRSLLDVLRQRHEPASRSPTATLARLDALIAQAGAAGVEVRTELDGEARALPLGVDTAAFRIVQEALTNVIRHAGPATATVRVAYGEADFTVAVDDDDHGPRVRNRAGGGMGLLGMRERVAAVGGELEAGPRPGGGSGCEPACLWTASRDPGRLTDQRTSNLLGQAGKDRSMTTVKAREPSIVRTGVALLAAVYAATFVVAVLLHVGVEVSLGFAVLDEPRRPFAVIVEGVAGIALAVGSLAAFARKTWAWAAVTTAHGLALAGVLWGMVAVAAGRGPHTQLNDTYHRVMVVALAATLILLLTPLGRNSLGQERR